MLKSHRVLTPLKKMNTGASVTKPRNSRSALFIGKVREEQRSHS